MWQAGRTGAVARFIAAALIALGALASGGYGPARAQFDQLDRYNYGPRGGDPYGGARQRPVRPRGDPGYGYGYRAQPQAYQPRYYGGQPSPGGGYYYYPSQPSYGGQDRRYYRDDRYYRDEREVRRPDPAERRRARVRPTPSPQTRTAEKEPEVEPTSFVVVFGDSTAKHLSDGLDEAYEEVLEVGIEDRSKAESGLVRPESYDWPKAIQDYLATNPKITVAVMMIGINDRQPIREGDTQHEPLSDRWKELYRDRVDAVVRAFSDRKIPVIWVSAPPVRNENLSDGLSAINDIYRGRVQRAGGVYVDIWPGFVTEDGAYTASGPNLSGQQARLRSSDGIHFTPTGARKAAHFVETELKRIFEQKPGTAVSTAPGAKDAAGAPQSVDQIINAAVPALPEPEGLPPITAKPRPLAGPVVPLTRPEVAPGGALASGAPKLEGDTGQIVDRALRQGAPGDPKPGRADDFRWPPKS